MEIRSYLGEVSRLERILENKREEIRRLQALAASLSAPTAGDRVVTSGVKDRMGVVDRWVDLQGELDEDVERLLAARQERVRFLEQLENPGEYDILHKKYIQHMTLEQIAESADRSYTWATGLHRKALRSAQELLDAGWVTSTKISGRS